MSRLRVALCFGTYPPERNGGSDFVDRLARALAERGTEVLVLTSAGVPAEEKVAAGVLVRRVISDWGRRNCLRQANALLAAAGTHLVHVFFPDSVLQASYLLPAGLGAGRISLVTTFWNLGLGRRSPLGVKVEALALLARSTVVTSHDPRYLATLRRGVGWAKPVHLLPVGNNLDAVVDGTSPQVLREELGLEPAARWIAYFGQLDATRGVEDLFQALALLRQDRDVRLLMIGSAGRPERYADAASAAYLRTTLSLPAQLGLERAVVWTDYLPDADVVRHLRAAELVVLPYRRNSLGRSALAASLEYGLPTVLAGRADAIAPLSPGINVASVPSCDPDQLARTVGDLLDDPSRRQQLAAGALAAAPLFSWPNIAVTAERIYARALG